MYARRYAYAYSWNLDYKIIVSFSRKHFYHWIGIKISHYTGVFVLRFPLSFDSLSGVKLERDHNVKAQTLVETFHQAYSNFLIGRETANGAESLQSFHPKLSAHMGTWELYHIYIYEYLNSGWNVFRRVLNSFNWRALTINNHRSSGFIRLLRQCCFVWSEIVGPHSLSLKLRDECGPTISDHTKQHCRNKWSMITPEAWTPVIIYIYILEVLWWPSRQSLVLLQRSFQELLSLTVRQVRWAEYTCQVHNVL